jgi:hypothetical protein
MNTSERKELIIKILDGSSNRLRESYFISNYNSISDEINLFCSKINFLPFKQKIWHWVNDIDTEFLCKCGKKVSFNKNWIDGYRKACSPRCSQNDEQTKNKRKKTCIDRYGVDNVAKSEKIKNAQETTNLIKYGHKSSFQNEKVKQKWKETIKEKYGESHIFQVTSIKEKVRNTNLVKYKKSTYTQTDDFIIKTKLTNLSKYGEEWYTQTDEFKEKSKNSNNLKFGQDYYSKTEDYKENVKKINLEKYGVQWYMQSDDFKEKSKNKILELYNVDHYSKSDNYKNYINSEDFRNIKYKERIDFYKNKGFEFVSPVDGGLVKLRSSVCQHIFDIHPTTLQRRMDSNVEECTICNPINSSKSGQELNLIKWVSEIVPNVITSAKNIISPYELDIFLPDMNLAIEFNGLYWHSELYKDSRYHLNKLILCEEKSIDLIQIWEDDWIYKQDIVKSIIENRITNSKIKIYARKCILIEIKERQIVDDFLNQNHIQGSTKYKTAIGLYYQDELVSCMLFNKPRKQNELVRFCSKIGLNVVGAASKIFRYYTNEYNLDSNLIVSFADRSMFTGKLYELLGFELVYRTAPNYWWIVNGIRKHRFTYNKKKLVKSGFDPDKTEIEIMHELGNYRIWGCGQEKWIYKNRKAV